MQDVRASTWIRYRPLTKSKPNARHKRKHLPFGIDSLFKVGPFVEALAFPMTSLTGYPLTNKPNKQSCQNPFETSRELSSTLYLCLHIARGSTG